MPLICYRMEDALVQVEDPDPVLPFIKVKEGLGRTEYTPIFTNKHGKDDFISAMFLLDVVEEHLRQYQFRILDETSFVFKMVPVGGISDGSG